MFSIPQIIIGYISKDCVLITILVIDLVIATSSTCTTSTSTRTALHVSFVFGNIRLTNNLKYLCHEYPSFHSQIVQYLLCDLVVTTSSTTTAAASTIAALHVSLIVGNIRLTSDLKYLCHEYPSFHSQIVRNLLCDLVVTAQSIPPLVPFPHHI